MKVVIFGNSGSGKSTLAQKLVREHSLSHLDLDTIAWQKTSPPVRTPIETSKTEIFEFLQDNSKWVIEGCYADLLSIAIESCTELLFLNPGTETCIRHSKGRSWEPHKYASLEAQNENLEMLLNWVRQYEVRNDEFSLNAHRQIFNSFHGKKSEFKDSLPL